MLKKSIKNNYLIFLILITFVFISYFLSAFIPNAFAADNKKDTKEETTPICESQKLQQSKLKDVPDPLYVLQNVTNSLTTKTNLATSKIVYNMKSYFKIQYPEQSNAKYINKFMDLIYDDVLNVDHWEDVEVVHFKKETYDDDSLKETLKSQLNFIFAQTYLSASNKADSSCQYLLNSMKSFYPDAIISTINELWYPTK